jgi:ubiquinone/menaquinone biosynthesis C-methylase UbiE
MTQESNPVAPMVLHCCALLRERLTGPAPLSGVLVGCGKGDEVAYLRRAFASARIVGLDLEAGFSPLARAERCVVRADATALPFASAVFDFAAAFHSLEHVGDARAALDEIQRVLRPGGWLYVGVPNRSRLVAYIGSFDATPFQKVAWNVQDWWARARGRFRNEAGAHAGFEQKELAEMLASRFSKTRILTEEYLRFKYSSRLPNLILNFLLGPRVLEYSAAAHYALCQKAGPSTGTPPQDWTSISED